MKRKSHVLSEFGFELEYDSVDSGIAQTLKPADRMFDSRGGLPQLYSGIFLSLADVRKKGLEEI